MSDLVGNPEDRFSHDEAHITLPLHKNKTMRSFKSSGHIKERGDGPYRGFGYLSLQI